MTVVLIAALAVSIVVAGIAVATARHWFAVPAVAVVAATIVVSLAVPLTVSGAPWLSVAIKGLGRFSELDDSRARERFIIGTLTSLIWAGTCAAAIMLVA